MPQALGKGFAECNTRQTAHGIYSVGKQLFAECFFIAHSANDLPSVKFDTRQKKSGLPSVFQNTLGKKSGLPSVFQNTLGKILFTLKKIISLCIFQLHEATRCKIKKNGYVNNEINTKLGPNSSCESNAVTTNYSKIYNK